MSAGRGYRQLALALASASLLVPATSWAQAAASDFTTGFRYDAARRVTGRISPDPDAGGALHYAAVRSTYDSAGRLIKTESGELASWQAETVAPASWAGFTIFQTLDTTYDALDRKLSDRTSSGGTTYTLTQYSYDAIGRPDCSVVRMNTAAFASPPAACTLGTEGSAGPDRITRNVYDAANQLLKVQKAYATPLQQDYATYTYNTNGRQTSLVDANGNRASMSYDGFDRQSAWNFPSKTTPGTASSTDFEAYSYDASGNRLTLQKRDGSTLSWTYDALNRVLTKIVPERSGTAATATRDVYYGYDLRGLQLYARFDSASGADGVASTYDGFGRLTSSASAFGGITRALGAQYDSDGNRTRLTFPDTSYFSYSYDGLDRATAIAENGSTSVVGVSYDSQARRASLTGVVATSYGYDPVSRLSLLTHDLAGTTGDVTLSFTQYNPASQLTTRTRSNDAYAWTGAVNLSRSYATNGLNQYTTAGPASFTYDANGNLTGDGTSTYGYDIENRLITASGGSTAALTYDPLGRLLQTGGGSAGTTQMLYDGDALVAEYDGSGTLLRRYIHGPGVDEPLLWYEGAGLTTRRSLRADHQGSVIAVAGPAGGLLAVNTYDEYGIPGSANLGRFQYTGQAWIPELGMYHYKARIYSPTLGRFLQTDPIGYADQNNLYAYVGNDPVNNRDPSGNDAVWVTNSDGSATLIIPVQFSGSGTTSANIASIVAKDNSISVSSSNIRIQVIATSSPVNGILNKMDFSPGYNNKMCGSAGECVNKLGGNRAHINSANDQGVDAAAHDVLHFAGIKDQYIEGPRDADGNRTSRPQPGYDNSNIMTSRAGTKLNAFQLNEAKSSPTTKRCSVQTGSRIPTCN